MSFPSSENNIENIQKRRSVGDRDKDSWLFGSPVTEHKCKAVDQLE